jgi:hypothetical protein
MSYNRNFSSELFAAHGGYDTTLYNVSVIGTNTDVDSGTTPEDFDVSAISSGLLETASTVVARSNNADDTNGGTGANVVTVYGLDENYDLAEEDITMAGTSNSSATTTTFLRVNKVEVKTAGSTDSNVGTIQIQTTGSLATMATINPEYGISHKGAYTVADSYSLHISNINISCPSLPASTEVEVHLMTKTTTGAWKTLKIYGLDNNQRFINDDLNYSLTIPSRSEVKFSCVSVTNDNVFVTGTIAGMLVQNIS